MKWISKLRKCWQLYCFKRQKPQVAERRALLVNAIEQGNQCPIGRAKRGRYD